MTLNHNFHKITKRNLWQFEIYDGIHRLSDIDVDHLTPKRVVRKFNVITNAGIIESQKRELGLISSSVSYCAVGAGKSAESRRDTTLQAELGRKAIQTRQLVGLQSQYRTAWTISDVLGNSAQISEAGLFTESSDGIMSARIVSDVPIRLDHNQTLTVTVYGDLVRETTV
ncbi:MAG: hypothetical protein OXC46_00810 [Thaumarchaeota archaeon]|nr:hypothetical protein [Nitrososphaerota archaeon]